MYQYKNAINPKTYIPEYMRIMIINFLSKNAEEWKDNYVNLFTTKSLTQNEISELLNWDAEKYRKEK